MKFSSNKFNEGRDPTNLLTERGKVTITFNKLIKRIKEDMKSDPKLDLAAAFDFYSVNCEYCQDNRSKIVEMYLLSSKELQIAIEKGEDIGEDRPDLILKCPECYQEKRVIDMRKHIAIQAVEPINESAGINGEMINVDFSRNADNPINAFPDEIRNRLYELLHMKTRNKQAQKELEQYIKRYSYMFKKIPKVLAQDYNALLTKGTTLMSVENLQI